MKILFVIKGLSNSGGGAERVFTTIIRNLNRKKYEAEILSFDPINAPIFYNIPEYIRHTRIPSGGVGGSTGIFQAIYRILSIRRYLRRRRPTCLVGFMHSSYFLLAVAKLGLRIPLISSEHIVPAHYRGSLPDLFAVFISYHFSAHFIVVSEQAKQLFPKMFHRRMVVIPNPIVLCDHSISGKSTKKGNIILYVGRFDAQKDPLTLVLAFSQVCHRYPDWTLVMVGDGSLRGSIESTVRDNNLQNRVFLVGYQRNVCRYYSMARLLVIPSKYESLGLVVIEAMRHGVPVIGFADCPGVNQLISHGGNGLLVYSEEVRADSLSCELDYALGNEGLLSLMGSTAKETRFPELDLNAVMSQWNALFELASGAAENRS